MTNQSLWYLRGKWPIHTGIYGSKNVCLNELKELINEGYVIVNVNIITGRPIYRLTDKGEEAKKNL